MLAQKAAGDKWVHAEGRLAGLVAWLPGDFGVQTWALAGSTRM